MLIRRRLTVAVWGLAVIVGGAAAGAKDFRTAFVRLVPEADWKPEKGKAIAVEVKYKVGNELASYASPVVTTIGAKEKRFRLPAASSPAMARST